MLIPRFSPFAAVLLLVVDLGAFIAQAAVLLAGPRVGLLPTVRHNRKPHSLRNRKAIRSASRNIVTKAGAYDARTGQGPASSLPTVIRVSFIEGRMP